MKKNFEEKYQKRKLLTTYISAMGINFLVVFLAGLLGLLLFNSKMVADHFKEQIALTIYFKDSSKQIDIQQIQKSIKFKDLTKSVVFTSKDEASKIYADEIGEDYMEFLGYNPLESSLDIYFNADYVKPQIIKDISDDLSKYSFISEIKYDQPLLNLLDKNIRKIGFWFLLSGLIFIIIAILLINSSIKLSIYAKRFEIKTMQLVGATKWFIQKPFLIKYFNLGLFSSTFSVILLYVISIELEKRIPELNLFNEKLTIILILISVFSFGLSITLISTFFATNRFLNLKSDEIY
ncbi:MAG: cell division protein FtsX [Flavobacteriaceae bacterium]|nr:cell division protein FtsX [Flavobacteriaceae bacterium]MBQ22752.1 cell division protein FtsX [Flavobacteriales bacterium]